VGEPHRLRVKVRLYETDLYGHVNHAQYVHYFETGRIEALASIGLAIEDMKQQGYLIFAADIFVKFHAPAHLGDELEIVTSVREMRGARSIWAQEVRHAATQRLIASGQVTGALMSDTGRPVRLPSAFTEKLALLYQPESTAP
jgi:acyl-CoA thioester hydrolase